MTAPGRVVRRVVATFLLVAVTGGCGIPLDSGPRSITTKPERQSTTTTAAPDGDTTTYVYFVKNDRLIDVTREVRNRQIEPVLAVLLNGPTAAETANGLISQIPAGAKILDVTESRETVRVEVSDQLLDVIGTAALQALGQIVLTITEIRPAATVEFVAKGEPLQVSSPVRGDVSQVSDCDFVSLFPTDDELREANLSNDSLLHSAQRRRDLEARCPDATESPS